MGWACIKWFSFHWWVPYQAFGQIGATQQLLHRFAPSSMRFEHDAKPQSPDAMARRDVSVASSSVGLPHQGLHCHESWIFRNQWSQSPIDSSSPVMSFHWASVSLLFRHCFTFWPGIGQGTIFDHCWLQSWSSAPEWKFASQRIQDAPRISLISELIGYIYIYNTRKLYGFSCLCTFCLWSKRFNLGQIMTWQQAFQSASYFYLPRGSKEDCCISYAYIIFLVAIHKVRPVACNMR